MEENISKRLRRLKRKYKEFEYAKKIASKFNPIEFFEIIQKNNVTELIDAGFKEEEAKDIVKKSSQLIVVGYPGRDLDRFLSFYNAAKECERDLVIDLKQAYLLKLFQSSEYWNKIFPTPNDKKIKIFSIKNSNI